MRVMKTLEDIGAVPSAEMRGALVDCARGLPLRAAGGVIKAFAMVDAEDYAYLSRHRWYMNQSGYAMRNVKIKPGRGNQRQMMLHRELLALPIGDPRQGDHINRDRLDNRRSNLRICTHAQNHQNRKSRAGSSSQYRGVSFHRRALKWAANGTLDGKTHFLGHFDDEQEAADVAAAWRRQHLPFSTD